MHHPYLPVLFQRNTFYFHLCIYKHPIPSFELIINFISSSTYLPRSMSTLNIVKLLKTPLLDHVTSINIYRKGRMVWKCRVIFKPFFPCVSFYFLITKGENRVRKKEKQKGEGKHFHIIPFKKKSHEKKLGRKKKTK